MAKRKRKVVFVGNCQAAMLAAVYRRRIAQQLDENVVAIAVSPPLTGDPKAIFAPARGADLLVEQVFDAPYQIPDGLLGPRARRVRFPYVGGRLLWPYCGVPHPANQPHRLMASGPYPPELGDNLLNRMIGEGVPFAEARSRYREHVQRTAGQIRRMAELHLELQAKRDAACDMAFASFIADNYRHTKLFLSQGHPDLPLSPMLVRSVFDVMDVPHSLTIETTRAMTESPFPNTELPLSPDVGAVLGLTYATETARYRFLNEGAFTFDAYVERYMRCHWEPELLESMALLNHDAQAALPLMQDVLSRCEGTATAWRTLAHALSRSDDDRGAVAALQTAIARDPADPAAYEALSNTQRRMGDLAGALNSARTAITISPASPAGHRALSSILAGSGRPAEAVAVARVALSLEPGAAPAMAHLAHTLTMHGDPASLQEAEVLLQRSLTIQPSNDGFARMLQLVREKQQALVSQVAA